MTQSLPDVLPSCILKTKTPQSGGNLAASSHSTLYHTIYQSLEGSFCYPFASTFQYSESQLTRELGSKDSMKGKHCVQMALEKPLGRHRGRDPHDIPRKSGPAKGAPAPRPRTVPRPEPGMSDLRRMEKIAGTELQWEHTFTEWNKGPNDPYLSLIHI